MKRKTRSFAASVIGAFFAFQVHAADHGDPIIIVDKGAASIILVQPLATIQEVLWSGLPLVSPTDAIFEEDGTLPIADPGAGAIFSFDKVAGVAPQPFIPSTGSSGWI